MTSKQHTNFEFLDDHDIIEVFLNSVDSFICRKRRFFVCEALKLRNLCNLRQGASVTIESK